MERTSSRRNRLLGLVTGAVIAAGLLVVGTSSPAIADGHDNSEVGVTADGNTAGGNINGFSALAYTLPVGGGGGGPIPCTLQGTPEVAQAIAEVLNTILGILPGPDPDLPIDEWIADGIGGHLKYVTQGAGLIPDTVRGGAQEGYPGTVYSVMCVPDTTAWGDFSRQPGFLSGILDILIDVNFQDFAFVPDGGPLAMYEATLESLIPSVPTIRTSPSPDVHSIVGIDTWLSIESDIWHDYGKSWNHNAAGVTVNAVLEAGPTALVFDPGDGSGSMSCGAGGVLGIGAAGTEGTSCYRTYSTASAGYAVTATATFTGSLTVASSGGGGGTWGGLTVSRIGELTLPVNQGEAIVED